MEIKIKTIELNPYLYKKAKYLPSEENFGIADVRITKDDNEELNVGIQFIDGKYIPTKIPKGSSAFPLAFLSIVFYSS